MYSPRTMELFHSRAHGGDLPQATHCGEARQPGGGPWVRVRLRVEGGTVREARWKTYGCPSAMACAEAACTWSEGRPLEGLTSLTSAQVIEWVDGVPEGREHCPELAVQALHAAAGG